MARSGFYILLWSLVVMLAGCAVSPVTIPEPEPQPAAEPAAPEKMEPPVRPGLEEEEPLSLAMVKQQHVVPRLEYYRQTRQEWDRLAVELEELVPRDQWPEGWNQCLVRVNDVTEKYETALEVLGALEAQGDSRWGEAVARLSAAYQADQEFIAGDCRQYYHLAEKTVDARLDRFHAVDHEQLQDALQHYARQGLSDEIKQNLEVWRRIGPDAVMPFPLLREVSLSLFRTGEKDTALSLLAEQEENLAKTTADTSAIARLRGDLLLIDGRHDEARRQYEEIAARHATADQQRRWVEEQLRLLRGETRASREERHLFLALLEDAVLFDGRGAVPTGVTRRLQRLEDQFPTGRLTMRAQLLAAEVQSRAEQWLASEVGAAEELLAEGDYDEATAALEALLEENLDRSQEEIVRDKLSQVRHTWLQEDDRGEQLEIQAQAMQWEEANRLLGMGKYDEAITIFSGLLDTKYAEGARRRLDEVSREASNELRRQAASLFVSARRSNDPEEAAELAAQSWQMLRRIIEVYPESDIVDRVKNNLASVENYLDELDPQLLKDLQEPEESTGFFRFWGN